MKLFISFFIYNKLLKNDKKILKNRKLCVIIQMEVREMDKKKLSTLSRIIRIFLIIFMICGCLVLLGLPLITKSIGIHFDLFIGMIYPCGLCLLFIVYEFIMMFKSLERSKPFVLINSIRFRKSMYTSFVIGILILISMLITNIYSYYSLQLKVALLLISIIFFGIGIAFYILSELFKQATLYKEENDLTI